MSALLPVCLLATTLVVAGCEAPEPVEEIRSLQAAGHYQASIEPLRTLLESRSADPEVYYLYGVALAHTQQPTLAIWPLGRAMESPEWLVPAGIQLAGAALTVRDLEMTIEATSRVLEVKPEHTGALLQRAFALSLTRQDYAGALADADRVLELEPDNSNARVIRGVALLGLDRVEEAGEAIEEATAHSEDSDLGVLGSSRLCAVRASFAKEKEELERAEEIFEECLDAFPTAFLVVDEAVQFFDERGRRERSLEIIRTAANEAPASRSYRISLVMRLLGRGEEEEAEALLVKATETDVPELAAIAWTDLAGFNYDHERFPVAVSAYEQALALAPDESPEMLFAYAEALLLAGRYDEALGVAERMTVEPHRELIRGRVALEQGRPEQALEHFGAGLELWPNNAVARYLAATAAEEVGDFDRAIEEYRYALRTDPDATDARLRLARLHLAEGEPALAHAVLLHQLQAQSRSLDVALLELEILGQLGRGQRLPQRIRDQIRPPRVWARGIVALADGTRTRSGPEAAAKVVLEADRLELTRPLNAPALESLVADLIAADRADEALSFADAAVRKRPGVAVFHAVRGRALEAARGPVDETRAAYARALELDPEEPLALSGLAQIEAGAGNVETALALYERAVAARPNQTGALRDLAALLIAQERVEEADRRLREALRRDPHDARAALRLAEIRSASGHSRQSAIALARRALRFGAGEDAASLLSQLGDASETAANTPAAAGTP
ncbi:MAG: tetratricopeptide repeat protein [Deltaproteobacteria bacterium]|nr:tetratricopeptide repeat protein [Deltaproteobacteria bacterium]MBW2385604.1 tetratricopeptide repeat protein [Deltaproteobacteria bacterium]